MFSYKQDKSVVESLLQNRPATFNKRLEPDLVGMMSNGEALILNKDNVVHKVSSYNDPLQLLKKDLRKYNFKNCDIKYGNFSGSACMEVVFDNSILDFANFKGTSLQKASFVGSSLVYANMAVTNLSEANFNGADLVHTIFTKKIVTKISESKTETDFEGSILRDIKAIESLLSSCEFRLCDLTRANFTGSDLKNVIIHSSPIACINLSTCKLSNVEFNTIKNADQITMEGSRVRNCFVDNSIFKNSSFVNTVFYGLTVNNSIFDHCNFFKCHFINCDFSRHPSHFRNCTFNKAKFVDSSIPFDVGTLNSCSFTDAIFEDCEVFVSPHQKAEEQLPFSARFINPSVKSNSLLKERLQKIYRRNPREHYIAR